MICKNKLSYTEVLQNISLDFEPPLKHIQNV